MKELLNSVYSIKPIETFYNGIFFRSRNEARWSRFFDLLGVKHFYEHEGYEIKTKTGTIKYLPDFYIPKQEGEGAIPVFNEMFFEIKPSRELTEQEHEKFAAFASALNDDKKTFGILREIPRDGFCITNMGNLGDFFRYFNHGYDVSHSFCICPFCWALGYQFEGKWDRIGCWCGDAKQKLTPSGESIKLVQGILDTAARAAASERFGG